MTLRTKYSTGRHRNYIRASLDKYNLKLFRRFQGFHKWFEKQKTSSKKYFKLSLSIQQKFKRYYGNLTNKELKKLYVIARASEGNTTTNLLKLLERRLDIILYRLHFSHSIFNSRQLIRHGYIFVNNKRIKNINFLIQPGDLIQIDDYYFYLLSLHLYNYIKKKFINDKKRLMRIKKVTKFPRKRRFLIFLSKRKNFRKFNRFNKKYDNSHRTFTILRKNQKKLKSRPKFNSSSLFIKNIMQQYQKKPHKIFIKNHLRILKPRKRYKSKITNKKNYKKSQKSSHKFIWVNYQRKNYRQLLNLQRFIRVKPSRFLFKLKKNYFIRKFRYRNKKSNFYFNKLKKNKTFKKCRNFFNSVFYKYRKMKGKRYIKFGNYMYTRNKFFYYNKKKNYHYKKNWKNKNFSNNFYNKTPYNKTQSTSYNKLNNNNNRFNRNKLNNTNKNINYDKKYNNGNKNSNYSYFNNKNFNNYNTTLNNTNKGFNNNKLMNNNNRFNNSNPRFNNNKFSNNTTKFNNNNRFKSYSTLPPMIVSTLMGYIKKYSKKGIKTKKFRKSNKYVQISKTLNLFRSNIDFDFKSTKIRLKKMKIRSNFKRYYPIWNMIGKFPISQFLGRRLKKLIKNTRRIEKNQNIKKNKKFNNMILLPSSSLRPLQKKIKRFIKNPHIRRIFKLSSYKLMYLPLSMEEKLKKRAKKLFFLKSDLTFNFYQLRKRTLRWFNNRKSYYRNKRNCRMRIIKKVLKLRKRQSGIKLNKFRRVKPHKKKILRYNLLLPNNFLINYHIMSALMVDSPEYIDLPNFMALHTYGRFLEGLHHKLS